MAGLYHEFFIVNRLLHNENYYIPTIDRGETVSLEDDFILYIYDSVKWVKSYNPSKKEFCMGLCLYGVTQIYGDSLIKFKNIIRVYRDLFEYAPSRIVLRGLYNFNESNDADLGGYEVLIYDKDELLKKLDMLIDVCKKALANNNYLLHYGI